jgi:CNT family concentrative nucleoside transporter
MILDILFGILGLSCLLGMAFLFSNNRNKIDWRLVGIGLLLQLTFAIFVLKVPGGEDVFNVVGKFFVVVINFTFEGAAFVFGILSSQSNMEKILPLALQNKGFGFIFAFQVLPTIIFFSSLMSVLYHLGIMQKVVETMAWVMAKTMRVSGAESLSVAANVFIGQTEAPLVVRPYVDSMTKSELLTLMVGGMATIAGGVLAAYVSILGGNDPQMQVYYAKHLLSASIMAAPATIVL